MTVAHAWPWSLHSASKLGISAYLLPSYLLFCVPFHSMNTTAGTAKAKITIHNGARLVKVFVLTSSLAPDRSFVTNGYKGITALSYY